jgi:hypothetical protein
MDRNGWLVFDCYERIILSSCPINKEEMTKSDQDKMPDFAFRMMSATFALKDWLFPGVDERVAGFGIQEGMTLPSMATDRGDTKSDLPGWSVNGERYTLSMCRN